MLFRFLIELSDIDRGVYESLDFRAARHPSEIGPYLLTRALAYCLSYRPNIEFSAKGLADPDGPALQVLSATGGMELWIEIGNPSPRKLHKASKVAQSVVVYTYKNSAALLTEIRAGNVHRADEIQIFALDTAMLLEIESHLEKNNRWSILVQDGLMSLNVGEQTFSATIAKLTP